MSRTGNPGEDVSGAGGVLELNGRVNDQNSVPDGRDGRGAQLQFRARSGSSTGEKYDGDVVGSGMKGLVVDDVPHQGTAQRSGPHTRCSTPRAPEPLWLPGTIVKGHVGDRLANERLPATGVGYVPHGHLLSDRIRFRPPVPLAGRGPRVVPEGPRQLRRPDCPPWKKLRRQSPRCRTRGSATAVPTTP